MSVVGRAAATRSVEAGRRAPRVRVGALWVDAVTFDGALAAIADLVAGGRGGAVYTPNVDHVVVAEGHARFRDAYARASLAVPDGMPVVWASRLLGTPVPEKVSGSDIVVPLARLAGRSRWRVYLLGGAPGVAAQAKATLRGGFGVNVVGIDAPIVSADGVCEDEEAVLARIRRARPDLLLVAFGAPKQEVWIDRCLPALGPAVAIAVGASLDFLTGHATRAPRWMSRSGLEWVYRLLREPRRLWRRYLVRGPRFAAIVARTAQAPRGDRILAGGRGNA